MADALTKSGNISQFKIRELIGLRTDISEKKLQLRLLKKEIEGLKLDHEIIEGEVINYFDEGIKVSPGKHFLSIRVELKLPRLSWKGLFEKYVKNGASKAQELMDEREEDEIRCLTIGSK